jgi:DNA-binding NtrC family response regulator
MAQASAILPTILIVDDDSSVLSLLTQVMRRLAPGHEVIPTGDGEQALHLLAQHPICLLLTDYQLPGLNGLQLAAAAKQHLPSTCVVLMSGDVLTPAAQQERAQQVDYYLHKPFPFQQLQAIVDIALTSPGRPAAQEQEVGAAGERRANDSSDFTAMK